VRINCPTSNGKTDSRKESRNAAPRTTQEIRHTYATQMLQKNELQPSRKIIVGESYTYTPFRTYGKV